MTDSSLKPPKFSATIYCNILHAFHHHLITGKTLHTAALHKIANMN